MAHLNHASHVLASTKLARPARNPAPMIDHGDCLAAAWDAVHDAMPDG